MSLPGPGILVVGNPGDGKSINTIIPSLKAGLEVFVADFDCGAHLLRSWLTPEENSRFHVVPLKDKTQWKTSSVTTFANGQKRQLPVKVADIEKPSAMSKFLNLLDNWTDPDGKTYGSPFSWPAERVLVVDSGTEMGEAIMRWKMNEIGRGGLAPRINEWSGPQGVETTILSDLISAPCTFLALYHLKHLRVPTIIDDDIDVVLDHSDPTKSTKKGGSEIDSTFTKSLWPTGLGEKNARTGVPKLFTIMIKPQHTQPKGAKEAEYSFQLVADETIGIKMPLPPEKRKELQALPAMEAFPKMLSMFGVKIDD